MIAVNIAHAASERDDRDDAVAPDLRPQLLAAVAAPEQAVDAVELTGGEQADGPRAPDAAEAVDGDGADRIVDAEVLDDVDADDHDGAADQSDDHGPDVFTQ